jgi:hypothetical protein
MNHRALEFWKFVGQFRARVALVAKSKIPELSQTLQDGGARWKHKDGGINGSKLTEDISLLFVCVLL